MENEKICEICGKPIYKHTFKEGARDHVLSYLGVIRKGKQHGVTRCSDPFCEYNHGTGILKCGDKECTV